MPLERVEFVCGEMFLDLRRRSQLVLACPVSDVRLRCDLCESRFAVCEWRKCSMTYISGLVVVSGGLRCLVTLALHGEGGTRDLQWWCFAWLTWCFINNGCCVVAWPRCPYDGFPLSISELLVTMMWKLPTTSLMCKAEGGEGQWWERLSSSASSCRSPMIRVV